MEITMARGDMETRTFQIRSPDGTPYTDELDEIYFTVKKDANERSFRFQKRLSDGGIISTGDGTYEFTIQPQDTDGMGYGNYVFDIELVKDGEIKKTFMGMLILTREVTHSYNEGG